MFSLEMVAGDMSNGSSFGGNQNSKHMEMEFMKSREFMGSDYFQQSPGLARYRSAPSSFLAALVDSPVDNSSSGDESDAALFSAVWNGSRDLNHKVGGVSNDSQIQTHFHLKQEIGGESGLPSYETPVAVSGGGGAIVGSYSVGLENQVQVRLNSGNGMILSNLARQNSSPAGFFNGFGVSSNHLNFSSSGACSSPRIMPSIPENGSIDDCENGQSRNGNIRDLGAAPYPHVAWSESMINDLKRNRDGNLKMFSTFNELQNQCGDTTKASTNLSHHLSLPNTLNEKIEPEKFKFLQFQPDVVPCQIRAKRGCATHPRSIAERMRRTRISERMKKLQELFPNMDKQTSTADMLDLAVEYIKDLQRQVQTLSETKAKCVCLPLPGTNGK